MSYNTILATTPLTSTGYHLKATGTTIGNSLIWDNGTNVGIGNTNTSYTLDVSGTLRATGAATFSSSVQTYRLKLIDSTSSTNFTLYTGVDNVNSIGFYNETTGVYNFKISPTGAATFSSSVQVGGSSTYGYIYGPSGQIFGSVGGNTTWINAGTNGLRFNNAADNQTRMFMSDAGNVGIGTTSPAALLNIQKSTNSGDYGVYPMVIINNSLATQGDGSTSYNFSGIYTNSGNGAVLMSMQSSYAAGTWEPQGILNVGTNHPMVFKTNATERMRITSGGDVLFQKTSSSPSSGVGGAYIYSAASPFFSVVGNGAYIYCFNQDAGAYRFFVSGAGQINATSTSITAISDISLKENIRDLETGLSEILRLKPRRFDWKEETKIGEKNVAGFIAQELESVLPELVYEYQYNDKETKKSIKMGDILPTLVKAIQEMNTKLDAQNQTIQSLQEQINILAK